MYPDRDEPGERLFLQLQKVLPNLVHHKLPQGCKDFINKLSIALKEADETEYWLKKLFQGGYIDLKGYESMHRDNEEIISILTKIIKTMKQKTT